MVAVGNVRIGIGRVANPEACRPFHGRSNHLFCSQSLAHGEWLLVSGGIQVGAGSSILYRPVSAFLFGKFIDKTWICFIKFFPVHG